MEVEFGAEIGIDAGIPWEFPDRLDERGTLPGQRVNAPAMLSFSIDLHHTDGKVGQCCNGRGPGQESLEDGGFDRLPPHGDSTFGD